jgi:hypothetical protein
MTKDEAREQLLHMCPKGTTVYLVLEHVSNSGMRRFIKPYVFERALPGESVSDRFIAGHVAALTGRKRPANRDGVQCDGCGMDMGFDLVYRLSMELYGDGYALNARWL